MGRTKEVKTKEVVETQKIVKAGIEVCGVPIIAAVHAIPLADLESLATKIERKAQDGTHKNQPMEWRIIRAFYQLRSDDAASTARLLAVVASRDENGRMLNKEGEPIEDDATTNKRPCVDNDKLETLVRQYPLVSSFGFTLKGNTGSVPIGTGWSRTRLDWAIGRIPSLESLVKTPTGGFYKGEDCYPSHVVAVSGAGQTQSQRTERVDQDWD